VPVRPLLEEVAQGLKPFVGVEISVRAPRDEHQRATVARHPARERLADAARRTRDQRNVLCHAGRPPSG